MSWDREKERKAGKAMGIGGCIYGVVFAVAWNVIAASMGAGFMLLFGLPFLGFMVFRLVMCLQTAKKEKNRCETQQPKHFERSGTDQTIPEDGAFCPFCGYPRQKEFDFCPKCGRRL